MTIAPLLEPGLAAYRRGQLAAARDAWRHAAQSLPEGSERVLVLGLAGLAAGLAERRAGGDGGAAFAEAETAILAVPDGTLGVDLLALRAALAGGLAAAELPPPIAPRQRLPLGATLRFLSLFAVVGAAALLLRFTAMGEMLERERMVAYFATLHESPWAPLVLLALYLVLAPLGLPMTPLIIAGGIVFGRLWGAAYNIIGCLLGAAASFQLARLLGRDFVRRFAGKKLKRVETMIRRRGFWGLVGVRFLPVPFPVVNFGAALAGVPFLTFLITAALGLTPALAVYTSFASQVFEVARGGDRTELRGIGALFLLVMALSVVPLLLQQRQRRRRYRRLLVQRKARAGATGGPPPR